MTPLFAAKGKSYYLLRLDALTLSSFLLSAIALCNICGESTVLRSSICLILAIPGYVAYYCLLLLLRIRSSPLADRQYCARVIRTERSRKKALAAIFSVTLRDTRLPDNTATKINSSFCFSFCCHPRRGVLLPSLELRAASCVAAVSPALSFSDRRPLFPFYRTKRLTQFL